MYTGGMIVYRGNHSQPDATFNLLFPTTTTVLRPSGWDYPDEPVPEEYQKKHSPAHSSSSSTCSEKNHFAISGGFHRLMHFVSSNQHFLVSEH